MNFHLVDMIPDSCLHFFVTYLYAPRLIQLMPKLYLDLMKPGCISKARV